jgi:sugar lactone lactonase YvrE
VARLLSRLILVLALAVLAGPAPRAPAVHAAPALQTVVVVGGQPDDITADAWGDLIWGDLARGTVERLSGGRITTLARGLSVPEGVIALPGGAIVVAEQGRDRVVRIERSGETTVLYTLQPVPGQEGVDGIGRDPRTGELLIPDSPRGTVLGLSPNGRRVRVIARGLGRPVDAACDARGNILVPDEHLGTLVVLTPRGTIAYRGALSTPDDVAIDRAGRVWITTLGDSSLWTIAPGTTAPRRVLRGLANPQGLTLDRCGDPIVVEQNTARIVRLLLTPRALRCPL